MIVKCQKPIGSNQENPPVLVYNQDRSFESFVPWDDLWKSLFELFGLKAYMGAKFFAEVHMDKTVIVVDKPLTQDLGW